MLALYGASRLQKDKRTVRVWFGSWKARRQLKISYLLVHFYWKLVLFALPPMISKSRDFVCVNVDDVVVVYRERYKLFRDMTESKKLRRGVLHKHQQPNPTVHHYLL